MVQRTAFVTINIISATFPGGAIYLDRIFMFSQYKGFIGQQRSTDCFLKKRFEIVVLPEPDFPQKIKPLLSIITPDECNIIPLYLISIIIKHIKKCSCFDYGNTFFG